MTSVISDERKILFIHLPKTGGSTIESILLKQPDFYTLQDKILRDKYLWKGLKAKNDDLNQKLHDYKVFTVIRHPEDRFLSSYNYFFHTKSKNLVKELDWTLPQALKNESKSWFLCRGFYVHAHVPMIKHLPHPKYINRIIRFEYFEEELREVLDEFKIPYDEIPHMRESNHKVTDLSERSRDLIFKKFRQDYEVFGYWRG